jgi:uncharacterized membrane protein (UPF0127 family)
MFIARGHRAAAAAGVLLAVAGAADAAEPLDLSTYPRAALEIVHRPHQQPLHKYRFDVWVADTNARAEQGLMFVRELPADRGMVFPLTPPRVETMWMKNTYIELDMLFIAPDGRVAKIIERARPLSLETLSSDAPVSAVLELRGGEARRLGLEVGDQVSWKPPEKASQPRVRTGPG